MLNLVILIGANATLIVAGISVIIFIFLRTTFLFYFLFYYFLFSFSYFFDQIVEKLGEKSNCS